MSDLPEPLAPADVDLRGFPFLPLDVVRLRDSDLAAEATAEEFRCAVLLWCASWHQVPAGSLPDADAVLSNLAGFGRAVREWRIHRDGALRGWVKCSDGRLYHPVIVEKALEAWEKRAKRSERGKRGAAAKWSPVNGTSTCDDMAQASVNDGISISTTDHKHDENGAYANGTSIPAAMLGDGNREGDREGQRQGERKQESPFSLRSNDAPAIPGCDDPPPDATDPDRSAASRPENRQDSVIPEPPDPVGPPPPGQFRPAEKPQKSADFSSNLAESCPPAPAVPEPPEPLDARTRLFREGLAAVRRLTGKPEPAARTLLGRLLREARDDCAALLAILADAERDRPVDPVPWLTAAARARANAPAPAAAPLLAGVDAASKSDPWHIQAWLARQPDVITGHDQAGSEVAAINGYDAALAAEMIAEAAALPPEWRGNWDALAAWLRDDIDITRAVCAAIQDQARRMRADGAAVHSVAVFDRAVRVAAARNVA